MSYNNVRKIDGPEERIQTYRNLLNQVSDPNLRECYQKEIRKNQERLAIINSQPYQSIGDKIYLRESDINKY